MPTVLFPINSVTNKGSMKDLPFWQFVGVEWYGGRCDCGLGVVGSRPAPVPRYQADHNLAPHRLCVVRALALEVKPLDCNRDNGHAQSTAVEPNYRHPLPRAGLRNHLTLVTRVTLVTHIHTYNTVYPNFNDEFVNTHTTQLIRTS